MGGLDNPLTKFRTPICGPCNNQRTQPHDLAFERLSASLRAHKSALKPGNVVRPRDFLRVATARELLNVHLYCVKLLGCTIMDAPTVGPPIQIDLAPFSAAIMNGSAHPDVYLQFGCNAYFAGEPRMGGNNPKVMNVNGRCARLDWYHFFGAGFGVRITYLVQGFTDTSLANAWHPRFGIARLVLLDLRQAATTR
jgi:hypothetical protein